MLGYIKPFEGELILDSCIEHTEFILVLSFWTQTQEDPHRLNSIFFVDKVLNQLKRLRQRGHTPRLGANCISHLVFQIHVILDISTR